jgi:hypothetical protein
MFAPTLSIEQAKKLLTQVKLGWPNIENGDMAVSGLVIAPEVRLWESLHGRNGASGAGVLYRVCTENTSNLVEWRVPDGLSPTIEIRQALGGECVVLSTGMPLRLLHLPARPVDHVKCVVIPIGRVRQIYSQFRTNLQERQGWEPNGLKISPTHERVDPTMSPSWVLNGMSADSQGRMIGVFSRALLSIIEELEEIVAPSQWQEGKELVKGWVEKVKKAERLIERRLGGRSK